MHAKYVHKSQDPFTNEPQTERKATFTMDIIFRGNPASSTQGNYSDLDDLQCGTIRANMCGIGGRGVGSNSSITKTGREDRRMEDSHFYMYVPIHFPVRWPRMPKEGFTSQQMRLA